MAIDIMFQKKLGAFKLDLHLQSDSRRIGILGASGCGKSMTLKCLAGIEKPDAGRIVIDGNVVFDAAANVNWKPQRRNIGYLFQNYALFPTMSVKANIAAGLKGSKTENEMRVQEMLEKFRLKGQENHMPGELSGGQQQRVALARIMAYEPDMILLDEPFSALDVFLKDKLQQEMKEMLEDYKGTVILVSHSRDEIYRFSEELLIMDDGMRICFGPAKEIFVNPQSKAAARLTGCKNIVSYHRIDEQMLTIPDWGVTLKLSSEIPEATGFIGVRAHDFVPVWGPAERDCIPVELKSMAELPFERKYFLKAVKKDADEICWFVQRAQWEELEKRGMPDFLRITVDKILFLK